MTSDNNNVSPGLSAAGLAEFSMYFNGEAMSKARTKIQKRYIFPLILLSLMSLSYPAVTIYAWGPRLVLEISSKPHDVTPLSNKQEYDSMRTKSNKTTRWVFVSITGLLGLVLLLNTTTGSANMEISRNLQKLTQAENPSPTQNPLLSFINGKNPGYKYGQPEYALLCLGCAMAASILPAFVFVHKISILMDKTNWILLFPVFFYAGVYIVQYSQRIAERKGTFYLQRMNARNRLVGKHLKEIINKLRQDEKIIDAIVFNLQRKSINKFLLIMTNERLFTIGGPRPAIIIALQKVFPTTDIIEIPIRSITSVSLERTSILYNFKMALKINKAKTPAIIDYEYAGNEFIKTLETLVECPHT